MPDTRGIGLVLLDPMMTMWLGAQHGPDPDPLLFEPVPAAQGEHLEQWASWRRARARR